MDVGVWSFFHFFPRCLSRSRRLTCLKHGRKTGCVIRPRKEFVMNKIQRCKTWLRAHEDLFIDLVRIYLGCGLVVKAVFLMNHRDYLMQMITDSDIGWLG